MAVADKSRGTKTRSYGERIISNSYFQVTYFGLTSYAVGVRGRQKAAILAAAVAGRAETAARMAIHLGNGRRSHLLHLGRLLVRRPTHSAH